jgi:hypothetical protein
MKRIIYQLAVTLGFAHAASAQSACLPADGELDLRLRLTRRVVTSTDPDAIALRQRQQITAVADSSVQPVSNDSICVAARDSYNSALSLIDQRTGRRVYVIRVGDKYFVEDPTLKYGEFGVMIVLDQSFLVLSKWVQ